MLRVYCQSRHAGQRHLQRNGHLALDLLGRGAGILGDDLDDGRRRIGIGLDVDVIERVNAERRPGPIARRTTIRALLTAHSMSLRTMTAVQSSRARSAAE